MNEQYGKARFDCWAESYEKEIAECDAAGEYPFAGYAALQRQIEEIVHAREGVSVLDLGCGTGRLASRLLELGHPVTALDFSEKMLEQAEKNAPGAIFLRDSFDPSLPERLQGQQFDCIVACYSLHHLPDPEKYALLRGLKAQLKPEGVILIGDVSFPCRADLEAVREAYGEEWDENEFYFVRAELEEALPDYDTDVIPISFCADVMILSPAE